jgi:hypothetical protein
VTIIDRLRLAHFDKKLFANILDFLIAFKLSANKVSE